MTPPSDINDFDDEPWSDLDVATFVSEATLLSGTDADRFVYVVTGGYDTPQQGGTRWLAEDTDTPGDYLLRTVVVYDADTDLATNAAAAAAPGAPFGSFTVTQHGRPRLYVHPWTAELAAWPFGQELARAVRTIRAGAPNTSTAAEDALLITSLAAEHADFDIDGDACHELAARRLSAELAHAEPGIDI